MFKLVMAAICLFPMSHIEETETTRVKTGLATYYGEWHEGRTMANGDPFRKDHLTLASRDVPLGKWVKVVVRSVKSRGYTGPPLTGREVWCQSTDRGPYGAYTEEHGRVQRMHYSRSREMWRVKKFKDKNWYWSKDKPGRYRGLVDLSYGCITHLTGLKKPPNLIVKIFY